MLLKAVNIYTVSCYSWARTVVILQSNQMEMKVFTNAQRLKQLKSDSSGILLGQISSKLIMDSI